MKSFYLINIISTSFFTSSKNSIKLLSNLKYNTSFAVFLSYSLLEGDHFSILYYALSNKKNFKNFIKYGFDINSTDENGHSLLEKLANDNIDKKTGLIKTSNQEDYDNKLKILLDYGINKHKKDEFYPLYQALGNKKLLKDLIDSGFDINSVDENGHSLIYKLIDISKGSFYDYTKIENLLDYEIIPIKEEEYKILSSLVYKENIFEKLIDLGFNINCVDAGGNTILSSYMGSNFWNNIDRIKFLLEC